MAVLGWLGTRGMFFLDASLPCRTASGVRGEQALDGWEQSFPEPNSQEFLCSTASTVNSQPVGVLCPSATLCLLDRCPVCLPLGLSLMASLLPPPLFVGPCPEQLSETGAIFHGS